MGNRSIQRDAWGWAGQGAFWIVLAGLILLGSCSGRPAFACSLRQCCSAELCRPMGDDGEPEPAAVPGGYLTHDGFFTAADDARPSPDGRFHICRYRGPSNQSVIRLLAGTCLMVPKPSA